MWQMKYLERKQNLQTWDRNSLAQGQERQCVPVDLAVKEADSKGSLLDRVAALEHRLFQVNLLSSISLKSRYSQCILTHFALRFGFEEWFYTAYLVMNKSTAWLRSSCDDFFFFFENPSCDELIDYTWTSTTLVYPKNVLIINLTSLIVY